MVISKAQQGPVTRERVDEMLFAVGRAALDLERTNDAMQREIDRVKERYVTSIHIQTQDFEARALALRLAVEDSRPDLFPGKPKTIGLLFGKVGFRAQPGRIVLADGVTGEDAAALLEGKQLPQLVRIRKDPARDTIRQRLADGEVDPDLLDKCGIVIRAGGEHFWYELDRPAVKNKLAEGR